LLPGGLLPGGLLSGGLLSGGLLLGGLLLGGLLLGGLLLGGCLGSGRDQAMGNAGVQGVEQIERAYWTATPGANTLDGIDVSYWQTITSWSSVAGDGIVFAFIRVSDGDPNAGGVEDTDFDANWAAAKAAGIIVGPYQFFRPAQDPVAQADYVISKLGGAMTPGDLPPACDVEDGGGLSNAQVIAAIDQWVTRIENQLGVTPIIYTSASLWQQYTGDTAQFSAYPLWVAHYTGNTTGPFWVPDGWSEWAFWQYSSTGSVAGISNNVDLNFFNGTLADLEALTYGDPVCGDGTCNGDEDHQSCPQDCPVCENVPPLGRIVDEQDLCFEAGGDPRWWRYVTDAGYDSSLMWTHTVGSAQELDNHGIWHLTFDEGGAYRVEAYTDLTYAQSQQARYQVRFGGVEDTVVVDQTATDGWALVGEFDFAGGGDQWVRLEDYTGEPLSTDTQIVFDAVRLTRMDPGPDGGVDAGPPADAGPGVDAGDATEVDAGPGVDGDLDPDPDPKDGGCSCRAGGAGGAAGAEGATGVGALALLLTLLGWIRRRGRR
jgi:lysozyme